MINLASLSGVGGGAELWSQHTSQTKEPTKVTSFWLDICICFNQGHIQGTVASAERNSQKELVGTAGKGLAIL